MAGLLRYRLSVAVDGLLFQNQDAEFEALSQRRYQEEGPVPPGNKVLLEVFDRYMRRMVSLRFCKVIARKSCRIVPLTFVQVTFPNGVFSGTIISSVVKNGSILKTAEWQLLLGSIAIPGVLIGAWLCDRLGRKNTMMLGFSGYCTHLAESQGFADMLQWSSD